MTNAENDRSKGVFSDHQCVNGQLNLKARTHNSILMLQSSWRSLKSGKIMKSRENCSKQLKHLDCVSKKFVEIEKIWWRSKILMA